MGQDGAGCLEAETRPDIVTLQPIGGETVVSSQFEFLSQAVGIGLLAGIVEALLPAEIHVTTSSASCSMSRMA